MILLPPGNISISLTSAILSKRANKSFKIFTSSWADVLLANSVKPFKVSSVVNAMIWKKNCNGKDDTK